MDDHNALADSKEPLSSRLSLIAIVLILVALVGAYVSAGYGRTLASLLQEQREFNESFGELNLEDPTQIGIVAVSPAATDLPPWVDPENIWVFRLHIPPNYGVSWSENEGDIAANSPLRRGGGSSCSGSKSKKAKEIQLIVTTKIENGRLKGSAVDDTTTWKFSLPKKLTVDSWDELVLDTIVKPGQPMRTFAVDEAMCVWRIRGKKPSKKLLNDTKLFPGCAIYLHETSKYDAFNRWSRGKASSMAD